MVPGVLWCQDHFFTRKHASQKIKTINRRSVLWCQDHFFTRAFGNDHMPLPPGWFYFCFHGKATDAIAKNRHHREAAAVRFRKLVAVRIWKVVASRGWWQRECHQNATITVAGLSVLISVAPRRYHTPPPPWFIFCFCSKATDATAKETTIKHVLWGSCGSRFAEAGGSQCYGWVSVRKLVASGGWWWRKCHPAAVRLVLFFIFAARQQMPLLPWSLWGVF